MIKKGLLVLMWAIFGLVFVLGKKALEYFYFLDFITLRMLGASIFFGIIYFLSSRNKMQAQLKEKVNEKLVKATGWSKNIPTSVLFCFATLAHVFLPFLLEYWATARLDPAKISLIYSFSPFVSAIIATKLHEESFSLNKKIGLLLGWVGASIPLFFSSSLSLITPGAADLALLLAVFFASIAWFIIEALLARNVSILFINFGSTIVSGILFLIIRIFLFDDLQNFNFTHILEIPLAGWQIFFGVFILSNLIGYSLYGYLLNFYSPTTLSLSGFLCPVFSKIFASFILGAIFFDISTIISFSLGLGGFLLFLNNKHFSWRKYCEK